MAPPLLAFEGDFDARAFTLLHLPTKRYQQSFNVAENNGRRRWPRKEGLQCFAVL
jgi:hypothetical protein